MAARSTRTRQPGVGEVTMKKLTLCTRYNELGASSRLRFYAYADALADAGYEVRIDPFFQRDYLERLYAGQGKSRPMALQSLLRRLLHAPFYPENLLIEYELFPQLPYAVEAVFLRNRQYVLNFDDNVWEKYRGNSRLADKYDQLISHAAGVIAANDYLAEKISRHNDNVIKIPTVVDLDAYLKTPPKQERFTLCWIGTPVTYEEYLLPFAPTLRAMAQQIPLQLFVIAKANLPTILGVPMECVNWSAEREAELIASCHAGIMPLNDDPFAHGKSAYKLIQCLAAGLPVIASPIGENCNVVTPECGFLPRTTTEWMQAVKTLQNPTLYAQYSAGATMRSQEFSLQKFRPVLTDFVRGCFLRK